MVRLQRVAFTHQFFGQVPNVSFIMLKATILLRGEAAVLYILVVPQDKGTGFCPLQLLFCSFFSARLTDPCFHCREPPTFMGLSLSHTFHSMRMKLTEICLSWELGPVMLLSFMSRRLLLLGRIPSLMFWSMLRHSHHPRNQSNNVLRCESCLLYYPHFSQSYWTGWCFFTLAMFSAPYLCGYPSSYSFGPMKQF